VNCHMKFNPKESMGYLSVIPHDPSSGVSIQIITCSHHMLSIAAAAIMSCVKTQKTKNNTAQSIHLTASIQTVSYHIHLKKLALAEYIHKMMQLFIIHAPYLNTAFGLLASTGQLRKMPGPKTTSSRPSLASPSFSRCHVHTTHSTAYIQTCQYQVHKFCIKLLIIWKQM